MSLEITPQTELEAVNSLLRSIGESPIETFVGLEFTDALNARALLAEVSRTAQTAGWFWNTEDAWPLTPDTSGNVYVPSNTLLFKCPDYPLYITRGQQVYDKENHTYTFSSSFTATLVLGLPWEQLPEAAKRYITISAMRRFQDTEEADQTIHSISAKDELGAWAALLNYEAEVGDFTVLNSALIARIKGNHV